MALILTATGCICLILMAITLGIQELQDSMVFILMLLGVAVVWLLINIFIIKKVDPELSVEVARLLYPSGALLSLGLSMFLSTILEAMIPGEEGLQHFILLFAGAGVAIFLFVRCFDIKWLRGEEEIALLEERNR